MGTESVTCQFMIALLGRITSVAYYRQSKAWSVCVDCVTDCLLVTTVNPAERMNRSRCRVWDVDSWKPKNDVLDGK